jgi:hypothetical protein
MAPGFIEIGCQTVEFRLNRDCQRGTILANLLCFRAATEKFHNRNEIFQIGYETFRDDSGMIGGGSHLKQMKEENTLFSSELHVWRSETRSLSLLDRR